MTWVEGIAVLAAGLCGLAEWIHARRVGRVALLAFGPAGRPAGWVRWVPALRVAGVGLVVWGLAGLHEIRPRAVQGKRVPEGGYRHLIVALDVSPSMRLKDAGPGGGQTRAQRAAVVIRSVLDRVALDQVRVSVVVFYTGAKPAVVDTFDRAVVDNILDDLPLDLAFDPGKTRLFDGLEECFGLARGWKEGSATLLVVSDGDSVPDRGMPQAPRSIARTLVVGVGDASAGRFIDGHQSRQDASALRMVAGRLGGLYHDGNERHLPREAFSGLGAVLPQVDPEGGRRREWLLAAVMGGATVLALLPWALAVGGVPVMGRGWTGSAGRGGLKAGKAGGAGSEV